MLSKDLFGPAGRGRQISKRAAITQFDKHYDEYLKIAVRAGEEEHLKE